jgi:lipopolysaccharide/colanic/teichoic acid biosynthesis glycosyltransferase
MNGHHKTVSYDVLKRVFDICAAIVWLILLSPVLVLIALAIIAIMGMPILFTQQRAGKDGKPFTLYKFRTMQTPSSSGSGEGEEMPKLSDEPSIYELVASDEERLTGVGRFLRATSLDELPELFNIVRGDMSFVGPRPLPVEYLPLYSAEQARRHEVRPGLTGLAQVSGRNALDWPERLKLDVEYVDSRSLVRDASIVLRTLRTLTSREGISNESSATMEPFRGER